MSRSRSRVEVEVRGKKQSRGASVIPSLDKVFNVRSPTFDHARPYKDFYFSFVGVLKNQLDFAFLHYIHHTRPDPITKRISAVPNYDWRDVSYICIYRSTCCYLDSYLGLKKRKNPPGKFGRGQNATGGTHQEISQHG